jgi:WD40 repeat protein
MSHDGKNSTKTCTVFQRKCPSLCSSRSTISSCGVLQVLYRGFSLPQTQPFQSTDTSIGHTSAVRTFGINESASIFGSGSRDRTVKLWSLDVCSGIENWRTDPFSECLISYNGHRRTTISDVHFLTGGGSSGVSDVVASCDGQVHVSVSENIICAVITCC